MQNKLLSSLISKNISWLQTMKQPTGYSGPVPHYWEDCFNYIGPGRDWRYEGVIISYLTLYEKTGDEKFLDLAKEAGNHLTKHQLKIGCFYNSGFDGNPSIARGSMPHDTAASIGLVKLALKLKELGQNWKPYFEAAKTNLDVFHIGLLYDKTANSFLQNTYDKQKYHVPNKLATLAELCLLVYEITGDEKYANIAKRNAELIIENQDNAEFFGGIYQVDKNHNKLISLYIARCISGLIKVYEFTKNPKYLESAINAADFLKTLEHKSGGFYFGYQKYNNEWKLYKYPMWIAGSGDIVRAFLLLKPYKKYNVNKNIEWITNQMHKSGGIPTSYGLNFKDKIIGEDYTGLPSCRDLIPAVGWNDKALRVLCALYKKGDIKFLRTESETKTCSDGVYYENENMIRISGDYPYEFNKKSVFSSNEKLQRGVLGLKSLALTSSTFARTKLISPCPINLNKNSKPK